LVLPTSQLQDALQKLQGLQLQGIMIFGCPQVQTFDPPNSPMNVLDTDDPDHLVAAILEKVDPDQTADTLLQNAQTLNQDAAAALLKDLDNIPASLLQETDRMASCDETGIPHVTERKKEERPRVSSVNASDNCDNWTLLVHSPNV
jgi:hypothetical protein